MIIYIHSHRICTSSVYIDLYGFFNDFSINEWTIEITGSYFYDEITATLRAILYATHRITGSRSLIYYITITTTCWTKCTYRSVSIDLCVSIGWSQILFLVVTEKGVLFFAINLRYMHGPMVVLRAGAIRFLETESFFSKNLFFVIFHIYLYFSFLWSQKMRHGVSYNNMYHMTQYDDYWLRYNPISQIREEARFIDLSIISKSTQLKQAAHIFSKSPSSGLSHWSHFATKSAVLRQ